MTAWRRTGPRAKATGSCDTGRPSGAWAEPVTSTSVPGLPQTKSVSCAILALLWQFYSRLCSINQWRQNGHRTGAHVPIRARMARRMAGSVGWGGGPVSPSVIFSPLRQGGEAGVLGEGGGGRDPGGGGGEGVPSATPGGV